MVLRFFLFAITFLFISCSDFERSNPEDPGGNNYRGSSAVVLSSSSSVEYTLACAAVPSTGIASTTITPPSVTCNGVAVSRNDLDWTNAPNWNNPAIGTYKGISVEASYGNCIGKTADCDGTLTVSATPSFDELTCTGMPKTGVTGTAVTQPTVRCGINQVAGVIWANAPNWDNPAASTYNVSATATCEGTIKTASCGTLNVASVLSCASVPTSGMAGTAITAPVVTCNGTAISSGFSWTRAPTWSNPEAGTYSDIYVFASSGNCSGKTATCGGTLTVGSILACSAVPSTGIASTTITPPVVTCNGTTVSSGLNWTGAPAWANPSSGTYSNISVSASSGDCGGKSATCNGTLTVGSVLSCASVPTSGTAGTAITAPAVTCNGTAISSGLNWTGAPAWANPAAGTYSSVSVSASSGNCSGKTASCSGALTVNAVPSKGNDIANYRTVTIGTQVWMAENLDYNVSGSKCYNDNPSNCATYGRLYDWATAMALDAGCNSNTCASQVGTKHRGICPSGWHIPNNDDWNILVKFVNPSCSNNRDCEGAGTKLKATSGWEKDYKGNSGNGTDNFDFAALPGGAYDSSEGRFLNVGYTSIWWSSSESNSSGAYYRYISAHYEIFYYYGVTKISLYSVRCLKD